MRNIKVCSSSKISSACLCHWDVSPFMRNNIKAILTLLALDTSLSEEEPETTSSYHSTTSQRTRSRKPWGHCTECSNIFSRPSGTLHLLLRPRCHWGMQLTRTTCIGGGMGCRTLSASERRWARCCRPYRPRRRSGRSRAPKKLQDSGSGGISSRTCREKNRLVYLSF